MTATTLLRELRTDGLTVARVGDAVRLGPKEAVTPDVAERVRAEKAALLEVLRAEETIAAVIQTAGIICERHTRFLTAAEIERRRCSWCFPEDRSDWEPDQRAAIEEMNATRGTPWTCLGCTRPLPVGLVYYCDACRSEGT